MSQDWFVIAPQRSILVLSGISCFSPRCYDSDAHKIPNYLFSPTIPRFISGREAAVQSRDPPLLRLPVEIIRELFEAIPDYGTKFFFCLCSPRLWAIGRAYLIKHILARSAPFANTPLVALGSGSSLDDVPPEMEGLADPWNLERTSNTLIVYPFTTRWRGFYFSPKTKPYMPPSGGQIMHCYIKTTNEFSEAMKDGSIAEITNDRAFRSYHPADFPQRGYRDLRCSNEDAFAWLKMQKYLPECYHDDMKYFAFPWRLYPKLKDKCIYALRNRTSKEYVSIAKLISEGDFRRVGDVDRTLGNFLIARCCWSSKPMDDDKAPENIHRGIWAGHQFDIVVESSEAVKGYTDVTEAVQSEASVVRRLVKQRRHHI